MTDHEQSKLDLATTMLEKILAVAAGYNSGSKTRRNVPTTEDVKLRVQQKMKEWEVVCLKRRGFW